MPEGRFLTGPLHFLQKEAGAQFFDWGGWQVVTGYADPLDEVDLVRDRVGFTDLPFLDHIAVSGPGAFDTLQGRISRDLSRCVTGSALYALALNDAGGIIEDMLILRPREDFFIVSVACRNPLLMSEAPAFFEAKRPKSWLIDGPVSTAPVMMREFGAYLISVQGPDARRMLAPAIGLDDLEPFRCREAMVHETPVLVSRTGYSGELGFEFLVWPEYAVAIWNTLCDLALSVGGGPYGIQAVMTLGVEKGYLFGGDYDFETTPYDIGMGWVVDLDCGAFRGREALLDASRAAPPVLLRGLRLPIDGPLPAAGDTVIQEGRAIGRVTNAARSRCLGATLVKARAESDVPDGAQISVATGGSECKGQLHHSIRHYDAGGARLRF